MANSLQEGYKIKVVDERSKWYRKTGTIKKLVWQSLLSGDEEIASAICILENVKEKVELKIKQIESAERK